MTSFAVVKHLTGFAVVGLLRLTAGQAALSLPKGGDDAMATAIALCAIAPNKKPAFAGFSEDTGSPPARG
jgi:hypothetical protein